MKVAIPTVGSRVDEHFGHARTFTLFTLNAPFTFFAFFTLYALVAFVSLVTFCTVHGPVVFG